MINISIPGFGQLSLQHAVFDVNGTIAVDGTLVEGLIPPFQALREHLTVHLLTADTHGQQDRIDEELNIKAAKVTRGQEAAQKAEFVRQLGADHVVAIGQGANDAEMLREAALGICIVSPEGTAAETLLAADLVVPNIQSALQLFQNPVRLKASLRK